METKIVNIKRGLDINFAIKAEPKISSIQLPETFEIIPDYYHGIIPKMRVKGGERVLAGTPLFYSKRDEAMNFVSPVSGTVKEVVRGERRKVLKVLITADKDTEYQKFDVKNPNDLTPNEIKEAMLKSGVWTFIKQRPYDIIADPTKQPKNIFISSFDSAPAAPDYEFLLKEKLHEFQAGIEALKKLTTGYVHLGINSENSIFNKILGVKKSVFIGKHPAGNVGVQINHIEPINKGETVWTVSPQDVSIIGRFFMTGKVDMTKVVSLVGAEVSAPQYYQIVAGAPIAEIVANKLIKVDYPIRYVSGNVLTGNKIDLQDSLSPYANQLTVLDDGSETHEVFGWAMPRINKFSSSCLYLSKLFKNKTFKWDARVLGGRRAIIMSNEYDKVFPMDILPEQLIKSMISGNIDKMESLGIYEVAPEDFALCEFVDTSKLPLQAIVRETLDSLRSEIE